MCLVEFYAVSTGASHLRSELHKNHMDLLMSDRVQGELKCKVSGPSQTTHTAATQWMMALDEDGGSDTSRKPWVWPVSPVYPGKASNKDEILFGVGCCWPSEQAGFNIPFARGYKGSKVRWFGLQQSQAAYRPTRTQDSFWRLSYTCWPHTEQSRHQGWIFVGRSKKGPQRTTGSYLSYLFACPRKGNSKLSAVSDVSWLEGSRQTGREGLGDGGQTEVMPHSSTTLFLKLPKTF